METYNEKEVGQYNHYSVEADHHNEVSKGGEGGNEKGVSVLFSIVPLP